MSHHETDNIFIVGSGAAGGTAAMVLANAGVNVTVLEAGPELPFADIHKAFGIGRDLKRVYRTLVSRSQRVQSLHPGYWQRNADLFVDDKENPYTSSGGTEFVWIRGRQVGGRSLTWGGVAARYSKYEIENTNDLGYGTWDVSYEDVAPYYASIEREIGVHGNADGLAQFPDGEYLPPVDFTPSEEQFRKALNDSYPERKLIIGRGLRAKNEPGDVGYPWAPRSSNGSTLARAIATGLTSVIPNTVVRKVILNDAGTRAIGLQAVHRVTKEVTEYRGRGVVLCGSTLETVRILLNSANDQHPDGLGNHSGHLGRFIMDHPSVTATFSTPFGDPSDPIQDLEASGSFFIPRYVNLEKQDEEFLGGFGFWGGIHRLRGKFPPKAKEGCTGLIVAHGECLPDTNNRVTISRQADAFGIPILDIACRWSENDQKLIAGMRKHLSEVVAAADGKEYDYSRLTYNPMARYMLGRCSKAMALPGCYIHELGGARMGRDPGESVVDQNCAIWGIDNLCVGDGACFPTSGWQSPTLTIMALCARTCEKLIERC